MIRSSRRKDEQPRCASVRSRPVTPPRFATEVCRPPPRWTAVSRRVAFGYGALEVTKTSKGVLITTARFSKEAASYVERLRQRVVLIDGEQLADLMIEHGVGVTTSRTYEIKRIDEDYFNTTDL